jgi:hypothetical protein
MSRKERGAASSGTSHRCNALGDQTPMYMFCFSYRQTLIHVPYIWALAMEPLPS